LPPELEDELSAELWARGSIGVELRAEGERTILDAYFPAPSDATLPDLMSVFSHRNVEIVGSVGVPDTDWLAVHRSLSRPFEVGRRWLVDPREPAGPAPRVAGRETLRIPARRAFGTGSHESTRLLLEWLEELPLVGLRVLDVGTGSGILSLAAERCGARVVGIDTDPVAVWLARENRRLNRGAIELVVADPGSLRGRAFDLALVNILPSEWLADAPALSGLLVGGAAVLLSGIPRDQAEELISAVAEYGLVVREERAVGDWVACRAEAES
jgi:ribosomal protein L11 methyltransferase